ncbi:ATP-binding protein [Paracoccus limosus]|uniref:ATP-binding protein n=1 Tax=Paracoccus limosus TaxID=913252 RepID=A0A844H5G9_9RHOB|nr:ATP-binding protein [Paracoccus limosus]MTH34461.1 ATP-binding protein [Paracoccus limosus]
MALMHRMTIRDLLGASALAISLIAGSAHADSVFTPVATEFAGQIRITGAVRGMPIYPGSEATVTGSGLQPGQTVTLLRGATVLNKDPITIDEKGGFSFALPVDADAAQGLQPIVVATENPASATVADLKISQQLPVSGADKFTVESKPVNPGLYQVAQSPKSGAIFVASSVGRPPIKESALVKLNPDTLEVETRITPAEAPERDGKPGGLFGVYGVAVDDANGNVWTSNTRQDTLAVYKQDDLSLVKQFEPGTVPHARDIVVDEGNGRVYASTSFGPDVMVFDAKTQEPLPAIHIPTKARGETFGAMALDLDAQHGKLATVSYNTPEAAIIDLKSGAVKVIELPRAKVASGVAFDAQDNLLFVVSQDTDNLLIVNAETGETLHDVEVGATPLNVTFEPKSRLAYIANRSAGTIAVVNTKGEIVANLETGGFPNQLRADGKGNVWAVNKSRGENDEAGDRIWRITAKAE